MALGLLFLGIEKTTVLDATLISAMAPIVSDIFGSIFLREEITKREKIGTAIAFLGTLITILEPLLKGGLFAPEKLIGNLLVLAYVVTTTLAAVLGKKLLTKNVPALALSNFSFIVGFVVVLPLTLINYSPIQLINLILATPLPYHLGVLYMAILSGTLAYFLWSKAQKTIEISEAGLFSYLVPIFAAPLAIFWLHEQVSLYFIIGAIIIILGIVIAETQPHKV